MPGQVSPKEPDELYRPNRILPSWEYTAESFLSYTFASCNEEFEGCALIDTAAQHGLIVVSGSRRCSSVTRACTRVLVKNDEQAKQQRPNVEHCETRPMWNDRAFAEDAAEPDAHLELRPHLQGPGPPDPQGEEEGEGGTQVRWARDELDDATYEPSSREEGAGPGGHWDSDVSPSGSFGNPCGVGCGDHGSASEDKLRLWRMDGPTQPQEPPWLIHKCPYCKYGGLI